MKVLVLDTETTGLDPLEGHKIIELAMKTYDLDSREAVSKLIQRFNPERPIDPKAQAVHGISFEELVDEPVFKDVASRIVDELNSADLVIAHNLQFDATFLLVELRNAGFELPTRPSVCTMSDARWATPNGKFPNLGELCFALEVEYDPEKAHSAEYDIDVTAACFFKGYERGFFKVEASA